MQRVTGVFVFVSALAVAACAGTPAHKAAAPGKIDDAASTALYAQLDRDNKRYASGLALLRAGETAKAQREMRAALDDLRAAATRCAELPGCDQQRFVAGFDALLRRGISAEPDDAALNEAADSASGANHEAGESSPAIVDLPQLGRSVALLKGRQLGDIIALNGPVKAALEEWLTQYRPNLLTAYENYEYMRHLMWPEYEKAGLPEALLFGMLAKESGGKVHAVSRSGASGPLQFMYATGLRFDLSTVDGFDERYDPRLSARANAAYINEQLAIFNNNLELVVGAYNGGEGAMRRRVARVGGAAPSFWDPGIYYDLSQETREYVPSVLAAAWLFMHPERYNLRLPRIAARGGQVILKRPASIAELTVCFGQEGNPRDGWFRVLRNLNPQLEPQEREPAGARIAVPLVLEEVYARNCVDGRWSLLADELHAAVVPAPPPIALARREASPPKSRTHTVRKGETLSSIARKSDCGSVNEIAAANRMSAPRYALKVGQKLALPKCSR